MRRKEKRLLQVAGLLIAALLFLPNVGLWSLYRDRVFDNSPDTLDGPGGIPLIQVRGSAAGWPGRSARLPAASRGCLAVCSRWLYPPEKPSNVSLFAAVEAEIRLRRCAISPQPLYSPTHQPSHSHTARVCVCVCVCEMGFLQNGPLAARCQRGRSLVRKRSRVTEGPRRGPRLGVTVKLESHGVQEVVWNVERAAVVRSQVRTPVRSFMVMSSSGHCVTLKGRLLSCHSVCRWEEEV